VITLALSMVLGAQVTIRTRIAIAVAGAVGAIVLIPVISTVFLDAGTEAGESAAYRVDLLQLVPQLTWFGGSANFTTLTANGDYLGAYASSVDNALLLIALRFGIIPVLLVILLLVMAVISVLIPHRANAASIALVAQIPAMFSVAFITQYGMFVWFVGGLAVTLLQVDRAAPRGGLVPSARLEAPPATSRHTVVTSGSAWP
jgi:hypothetical protein